MSEELKTLLLDLPIKTVSELNRRDHWRTVYKRKAGQKYEIGVEWRRATNGRKVALPCRVLLTRIGPKELDSDNLMSAFKSVRDQIAHLLGVDDSPDSLAQFEYRQKATGKRSYSVRIEVLSL